MRKFIVILFLLVFLSPIESTFGQTPSKFWIRSLEGKRFDSRKEKSPYVLSFFFVNCVPCIKERYLNFTNSWIQIIPMSPFFLLIPSRKIQRKIFKDSLKNWKYHYLISIRTHSDRSQRNSLKEKCLFLQLLV